MDRWVGRPAIGLGVEGAGSEKKGGGGERWGARSADPQVCYGGFLTVAGERSNSSYIAPYGHSTLDCDAEPAGSEGRFINDHRNTGRAKNVELRRHIDPVTGEVSIVGQVIAPIRAGCELLTSYGSKSYWECLELSDAAAMKHEETLALGTRISVKYYVDGQTTWFRGTVAEILAHGEYNVEFDVGTIETIRATAEYKILPCPAYTDATWPSSTVEHVSGYKWDSQLKFRHFYSAHRWSHTCSCVPAGAGEGLFGTDCRGTRRLKSACGTCVGHKHLQ